MKQFGGKCLRYKLAAACWAVGLTIALAPQAKAGFIGDYALSNFTLTNTNADGFVTPFGDGFMLTGGNTGSGLPGTTDFTTTATGTGVVNFNYSYSAFDFPGFDFAGYLIGNTFTKLADFDGDFGTASFMVTAGNKFGFRVGTADNTGEPGILTISNFTAPSGGSAGVPEPGAAPILAAAFAVAAAVRLRAHYGAKGVRA